MTNRIDTGLTSRITGVLMPALTVPTSSSRYADLTTSTPVDPEAPALPAASVSHGCANLSAAHRWTPAKEAFIVPADLYSICSACPVRRWCLDMAVETGSQGYWAGTTTDQRALMVEAGDVSVERARSIHDEAFRVMKHAPGEGSYQGYRDGCHCHECREANAQKRRLERRTAARRAGNAHAAA